MKRAGMTRARLAPPTLMALLWLASVPSVVAAPNGLADDPARRAAEVIEKALQKHAPEVHRCFEKALADRLDVGGNVEVEVDVGAAGKVKAAKLSIPGGSEAPADLATCVETAARGFVLLGIEPGASVVLPFSFQGQADQFAIKVADVPERGPHAAAAKRAGKVAAGPPGRPPPFAVKLLVDPVNTRGPKAALTLLTVAPKSRVATHRHPTSAKAFYLLSGRARFLGPTGTAPVIVDPGTAIFVPPGYPHALETLGKAESAVFLQIFTPPGPERVYRDPSDPEARAAFEVVRDGARAPAAAAGPAAAPVVSPAAAVAAVSTWGGKATTRTLLNQANTGSPDVSLIAIDVAAGAQWPRHSHEGATELIYVASGGGTLEVGSEQTAFTAETALFLPGGQPHALKFVATGPTRLIQIFAPAGPEQQAAAGVGPGGVQAGKKEESSR